MAGIDMAESPKNRKFEPAIIKRTKVVSNIPLHVKKYYARISCSDYDNNEDKKKDQAAQTYTLNCNGAEGDMIYITDLSPGNLGHGISEVKVYTFYGESQIILY